MNTIKIAFYFIVAVLLMLCGYFIRKGFETPCNGTQIVVHDTIPETVRDTVDKPVPFLVEHTLPGDTVYMPRHIDTLAILKDYYLKRSYEIDFSNDSIGTFIVQSVITENKLLKQTSQIKPKIKVVKVIETKTVEKIKPLQIYTLVGSSIDFRTQQISAGFDINQKFLIGVSGIRFDNNLGWTINAGVKF